MSADREPGSDQPAAQPISALSIVARIAVIFLLAPMLIALAARYFF
jgi:hypothetical protein